MRKSDSQRAKEISDRITRSHERKRVAAEFDRRVAELRERRKAREGDPIALRDVMMMQVEEAKCVYAAAAVRAMPDEPAP